MASNPTDLSTTDDDEYQVRHEDEEDDDERTIEEEEQLGSDDEQNELDNLQADANMPLDELLKLYGKNSSLIHSRAQEEDDNESNSSSEDNNEKHSRHKFHHLLQINGQLLPEDDDDDDTDDSFEIEIIKFIRVGDEYQAQVESQAEFNSTNGQYDDREVPVDELLWSPSSVNNDDNEKIDEYLKTIRNEYPFADDEISLQTLFNCQMNTELALIKFRQLPMKTIYTYSEWSLDEIQHLEEGLREYGKNFFKISLYKCPNRSVREIIHYYYQWKKSERYQLYMEEQQRLNAIISVTDMIEKLIEEQEQQLCTAVSVINSTNSSSILSNDLKRNSPNSSISIVTIHQQETTTTTTTKRSFDQVENNIEPPSKKSSLNTNNSPTTTVV
ncbi:unnamed protein product [Rotaria sp. Silwood1]|nr:unnamed protein product [Rotaria sp. Silwood1]CAF0969016.1 unnamed protein product [Rotaria sp. Silwood1]CAF3414612.1 unnamed protein product [Rotaria sp. Silwood1]CAF4555721.1 unnamed protein product [Rotaria sp. Silwood1]CAF4588509.1 unnamed protein product [Rotaria sp. Silwood1]